MTQIYRFGRRIVLPSTLQILHELMAFPAQEAARTPRIEVDALAATSGLATVSPHALPVEAAGP